MSSAILRRYAGIVTAQRFIVAMLHKSVPGDAHGLRASENGHAVEHACTDGDFGGLRTDLVRAHWQSPISLLRRYIRFSTSERLW